MMPAESVDESARDSGRTLVREVAAVAGQAAILRGVLAEWARERGFPPELTNDLKLTAYEAMTNVVKHAFPDDTDNTMTVTARHEADAITVTVTDTGRWRDGARTDGGRGLPIIRAFAPEVSVTSTPVGTTVRLSWPFPARP